MPDRIDLVRAKAERARECIHTLGEALNRFRDAQPYGIAIEEDVRAGSRVFKIDRIDEIPLEVPLLCGDAIQGLRSTLDHLAYQLFLVGGGAGVGRHIEYPIFESVGTYEAKCGKSVDGIREDARKAIDATRPYKGGNDTLWLIDMMSTIARQRLLLTVTASAPPRLPLLGSHVMAAIPAGSTAPVLLDAPIGDDLRCPLKVGDQIHSQPIDQESPDNMEVPVIVAFAEPGVIACKPVLGTLAQMMDLTDSVVEGFTSFL